MSRISQDRTRHRASHGSTGGTHPPAAAAQAPAPTSSGAASMPSVGVEVLPHAADLPPLAPQTAGAAGYDLRAAIETDVVLEPGRVRLVPTGLRLAIPPGFEAQVRPRSGLALRAQIGVLNSPGTIDSDYRGEVQVLLFNFGDAPFCVARGERIAQLVFARVHHPELELRQLDDTERGAGGFGHTGRG